MDIHQTIQSSIDTFIDNANNSLDYLTEDDMRCRLFHILQNNLISQQTRSSISIHAEVRWYGDRRGNRQVLKYRSDIVIIDNTTLEEGSIIFKAPSKGYGFNEYYCIIELKLRRYNGDSDNQFIKRIKKDFSKLSKIKEYTNSNLEPLYYLLVFDKKQNILPRMPVNRNISVIYKYFDTNPIESDTNSILNY